MSPLRIIVIAILLYIGFKLLFGGKKKDRDKARDQVEDFPNSDVLVEDPVCHALVPKGQAVVLKHKGEEIYFCSQKCCDIFTTQQGEDQ